MPLHGGRRQTLIHPLREVGVVPVDLVPDHVQVDRDPPVGELCGQLQHEVGVPCRCELAGVSDAQRVADCAAPGASHVDVGDDRLPQHRATGSIRHHSLDERAQFRGLAQHAATAAHDPRELGIAIAIEVGNALRDVGEVRPQDAPQCPEVDHGGRCA